MQINYLPKANLSTASSKHLTLILGTELSNLSGSCYKSQFKKLYNGMCDKFDITDSDIKLFLKKSFSKKTCQYKLLQDKFTLLLLIIILNAAKSNNIKLFQLTSILLAIKFHASRMYIALKYCNDDAFREALDQLSYKHLYKQKRGIPNAISHIGNTESKKYFSLMKSNNLTDDDLVKFVYAMRTRIAQSLKSFCRKYYKIVEDYNKGDQTTADVKMILHKLASDMCSYGMVDMKVAKVSASLAKIDLNLGTKILHKIANGEHFNQLFFIINLMHKSIPFNKIKTNEQDRIVLIKRILNGTKVGTYSIKGEIEKLIESANVDYIDLAAYSGPYVNFLCQYITLIYKYKY
jgi:hypothetical protein